MSDLTDDELDCTRLQKGLVSMQGLTAMEKKYKSRPEMIEKIKKAKRKIVIKRLLSGEM